MPFDPVEADEKTLLGPVSGKLKFKQLLSTPLPECSCYRIEVVLSTVGVLTLAKQSRLEHGTGVKQTYGLG